MDDLQTNCALVEGDPDRGTLEESVISQSLLQKVMFSWDN